MGKKTLVWAYLLILSLGTILSLYIPKDEVAAKDAIVIPGQAIRLRILANSDLNSDQALKREVRDRVNAKIGVWVKDLTSFQAARKVIKSKLPELKATAEEVVKENGSNETVNIKFGKVQFPTKLYGQFLYPAGEYEALLITLGKGEGANWWCVLFPPLCFLDFSNGIAVSKGFDEQKANSAGTAQAPLAKSGQKGKSDQSAKVSTTDATASGQSAGTTDATASGQSAGTTDSTASGQSAGTTDATASGQSAGTTDASASGQSAGTTDASASGQSAGTTDSTASGQSTGTTDSSAASQAAATTDASAPAQINPSEQSASTTQTAKVKKQEQKAPVYVTQDEQPIKVKFFIVELWQKLF